MRKWILALLTLLVVSPAAHAGCTQTGGNPNLEIPSFGDPGSTWGPCLARDLTKLSTTTLAAAATGPVTITISSWTWLASGGIKVSTLTASSATFTGTGGAYDITTATGIYLQAGEIAFKSGSGGVVWPDGTRTKSASSAGDMVKANANSVTGSIDMVSGSSLTIAPGTVTDTCYRINFASFTAVASITFSGLASSTNYRLDFEAMQNTSNGNTYVRFNGDSGSNYTFATIFSHSNSSSFSIGGGASTTQIYIANPGANSVKAGLPVSGRFEFKTMWGLPKSVRLGESSVQYAESSASIETSQTGGGWYTGAAVLSSVTLGATAGTLTGYAEVWNCGSWWKLQN